MSSGADINTGIASGSIDVGFMGVAPAITGIGGKGQAEGRASAKEATGHQAAKRRE